MTLQNYTSALLDKRDWDPCQDDQMVDLFSFTQKGTRKNKRKVEGRANTIKFSAKHIGDRLWNVDVECIMRAEAG
ncbi:hypothetical protein CMV_002493 [Castanea mollissima]|uniref:Uncharacterized protein n=1 Tax=Castanea mollissima TaxID=60419 RepID=A0A8J4W5T2_9ROSI|nr:hypothetical protein CMV_002493 [Castanea mollissima]